jgi:hypothetical protein
VKCNLPYVGVKIIQESSQTQDNYFIDIKPGMVIYDGTDDILFVCRFAWI